ncbi:MAG: NAD(P)H-dependent oxidoreductase [Pseudomonadota bacterium]
MKHAVIVAHPDSASLNATIARTYVAALEANGHEAELCDLYAMGFDPCLKTPEIPGPAAPEFGADVVAERERLADVDAFAFVYPLWFNAPPAILKGYVDRVFGMGFGFTPRFGGAEPALRGRRLISFTTSGAPDAWVRDTGAITTLRRLFDDHLAGVCGLEVVDHVHFGGMVSGITDEAFEAVLAEVRETAARRFPTA